MQYNLSAKISFLAQPAVKYAQLATHNIGTTQSYYQDNYDGSIIPSGNSVQETYNSYTVGGTYMEFELPILLKYYIAKKISVFGGVNLIYSKLTGITEHTNTLQVMTGTGLPIADYNGPLYQASPASQFHIGYMAGCSYELNQRWLVDALIEQSPLSPNIIGGYNMNAPISSMYYRLSIGYRLTNTHHDNPFGKKDTGRGD